MFQFHGRATRNAPATSDPTLLCVQATLPAGNEMAASSSNSTAGARETMQRRLMARVAFLRGPIMRRVERSACREFGPCRRCFVHAWCRSRLWFCSWLWFWIYAVAAQSVWRALYAVMPGMLWLLLSSELLLSLFFCELSPRCPDMRGLGHADFFWSRLQRHGLLHL